MTSFILLFSTIIAVVYSLSEAQHSKEPETLYHITWSSKYQTLGTRKELQTQSLGVRSGGRFTNDPFPRGRESSRALVPRWKQPSRRAVSRRLSESGHFRLTELPTEYRRKFLKTEGPQSLESLVKSFAETAVYFLRFFKRNEYGRIVLDHNYAMRSLIEVAKRNPTAAVAAAEVFVNNVNSYDDEAGVPRFDINFPGLVATLGANAVKSSPVGQLAGTVSMRVRGTSNSYLSNPRDSQESLISCLMRAVSSVQIGGRVYSAAKSFTRSVSGIGRFVQQPVAPSQEYTGIAEAFANAAMPCFKYFKRDKRGRISFDRNYAMRSLVGVAKQNPALAICVAEALVYNTNVRTDRAGNPVCDINFPGLAFALGRAFVMSTQAGQSARRSSGQKPPGRP